MFHLMNPTQIQMARGRRDECFGLPWLESPLVPSHLVGEKGDRTVLAVLSIVQLESAF